MPLPHSSKAGKASAAAIASLAVALAWMSPSASQTSGVGSEEEYIAAGIFETGLIAEMPEGANCPAIVSGFGDRKNRSGTLRGEYSRWSAHAGVDFGLPEGTPIVAIADGQVTTRDIDKPGSDTGNNVIITHSAITDGNNNGVSSGYAHLSRFNVNAGERVKRGQVIGFVGKTGTRVTYPHLHLNIFGRQKSQIGGKSFRYRYDFLQVLSGDMTPIDPVKKRNQKVRLAYMDRFGKVHPPEAKVIWPFVCEGKL